MANIEILVDSVSKINYSLISNGKRVINFIRLINHDDRSYSSLKVSISFSFDFFKTYDFYVDFLDKEQTIEENNILLNVNFEALYQVNEAIQGNIIVKIFEKENEEPIATLNKEVAILTFDEWGGASLGNEYLASFVLPNDLAIKDVLKLSLNYLHKIDEKLDFFGYQTDKKEDVVNEVSALFYALKSLNISYCVPKASFEFSGQKVRLPSEILKTKLSTCLDSSLLFAGVLEACGLNPLVIVIDEHAFVGVWLNDVYYSNSIIEDKSFIENKLGTNEILLLEATTFTSNQNFTINDCIEAGKLKIKTKTKFFEAVDIKAARANGIKPLPIFIDENGKYQIKKEDVKLDNANIDLTNPGTIDDNIKKDRFDVWEKKLLDLNNRNKLVCFNPSDNYAQIFTTDIYEFFNKLETNDLTIFPLGNEIKYDSNDKILNFNYKENEERFFSDLSLNRIRLALNDKKTQAVIKNLSRNAKESIEESGSNTLFITIGTLIYKEKGKKKYAPLILVPVDIVKNLQGKNYDVSIREEDILVNQTLFEYLKINFDINFDALLKIPYDESGEKLDLKKYFNTLRVKITGYEGWTLSDSSFIGIFSFTRFIMWNDLRNHKDELLESNIVKSLVDPSIPFKNNNLEIYTDDLDLLVTPNRFAIPLGADSSQTEAILDCAKGLSFVLNGPPGTGKSQTITNMIINSIYNGKRVLFVAQKMAALEVVKKRLDETGLGVFCVELHSNKAQKTDVLNQINKIIELGKLKKPEEYEEISNRVLEKRNELNEAIIKLHNTFSNGFDLYENIIEYEKYKNDVPNAKIQNIDFALITKENYLENISLLDEFKHLKNEIGLESFELFKPISLKEYSIESRIKIVEKLKEYKEIIDELDKEIFAYNEALNFPFEVNQNNLNLLKDILPYYDNEREFIYDFYLTSSDEEDRNKLKTILESYVYHYNTHLDLMLNYSPEVLNYDFEKALFTLKQAQNLGFFARKSKIKRVINELREYAKNPKLINKKNIEHKINEYRLFKDFNNKLPQYKTYLVKHIGTDYQGFETNVENVKIKLDKSEKLVELFDKLVDVDKTKFLEMLKRINHEDVSKIVDLLIKKNEYETQILNNEIDFNEFKFTSDWLKETSNQVSYIEDSIEKLKDFILFRDFLNKLTEHNLGNLIELNFDNEVNDDDLIKLYKRDVNYGLALKSIMNDKNLNIFSGRHENEIINDYIQLINKYNKLTIEEVASRVSKNVSNFFNAKENNELSKEFIILKKAISNGGRGISLRSLFDSSMNVIDSLCPCFLMSPLSVAQYLDPKNKKFDIVIFDEASQITTSDAVGAIARGESAIIVGDEKQLPPTRFFEADTSSDDDFFIEDGESILMDCLNISMPRKSLLWHYRSKDESLIAFSNVEYYENKLLTFPSPASINSAISFKYCENGIYEKRQNKVEAEQIVNEIINRLKDEKLREKSIGVVTFSIAQQSLILDKLATAFKKNPDLEAYAYQRKEGLFVKNLENVQGDERDCIIFSICYGPSKDGKISFNFGPLSNAGGEKRLNVAVSRAREEMIVFSSMKGADIDLNRAKGKGAKGLKEFLDYALNGKKFIIYKNGEQKEYKEGIEKYIARDLEKHGYKVHTNIGTSDFRVDIGIVDPSDESKYLLGILCDSKSYLNSKTCRDRNVTQTSVLSRLGWKTIRVWTLDYFDSPNLFITKIIDAINNADKIDNSLTLSNEKIEFKKEENNGRVRHAKPYVSREYHELINDKDLFFEESEDALKVINFFIDNEAPISYKRLSKKVLNVFGITKISPLAKKRLDILLASTYSAFTLENQFFFKNEEQAKNIDFYRINSEIDNMNDISKEEIAVAIKDILKDKLTLTYDELCKAIINEFGFSKISDNIKKIISCALDYALEKGYVVVEGTNIYYLNK